MSKTSARPIRFGDYELDVRAGELRRGSERIRLQEQPFQILLMLIEDPGEVVTREDIRRRLWPDDTIVEFDHSIGTAIKKLRQALGDEADNPRFVETLPRRGFRFIFPVEDLLEAPEPNVQTSDSLQASLSAQIEAAASTTAALPSKATAPRRRWIGIAAVVAIALVGFGVWAARRWMMPAARVLEEGSMMQITASPGLDIFPSLSPDASSIAYSSDQSGSFEIYVRSLARGGREIQLTADGQQNFEPAWSPDGRQIAYVSQKHGGIWLIPALGGTARQLVEFGSHPAWSPDGSKLVFQSGPLTDISQTSYDIMPPSTLWVIAMNGGQPIQLTHPGKPEGGHGVPSWSPDGKNVVFLSSAHNRDIWTVPAVGGEPRLLTSDGGADPVYAPDGRSIYFSQALTNSWQLRRLPLTEDGSAAGDSELVKDTGQILYKGLNFSADGRMMAFAAMGVASSLHSIKVAAGTLQALGPPVPLTRDTALRKTHPLFSPDGSKIAFSSVQVGNAWNVWITGPTGKDTISVAPATGAIAVGWFPDGRRLAIARRDGGYLALAMLDTESKMSTPLRRITSQWVPRISPDGTQLAYSVQQNGIMNIWIGPIAGGPDRQLTFDRESAGFPSWSPDGKWIAYEATRAVGDRIMVVPSSGGEPVELTHETAESWNDDWSPDGDKVFFAGSRNGVWNIYWVSRSGNAEGQITHYTNPNTYVRYPSISRKGDQIVYEYSETTGNIWTMRVK